MFTLYANNIDGTVWMFYKKLNFNKVVYFVDNFNEYDRLYYHFRSTVHVLGFLWKMEELLVLNVIEEFC